MYINKTILYTSIVVIHCIVLTLLPHSSKADHATGGELIYEWVSGNDYRFIYKGFFDCTGNPKPNSVNLCATNTCSGNSKYYIMDLWTGTIPPYNLSNCSPVPLRDCKKLATKCDSPAATTPGYKECWYSVVVTLTDTCSNWRFTTGVNSRSYVDNVVAGNQYLRATLNNVTAPQNSSPYFRSKSVFYCCSDRPVDFYNDIVDPDGDSIVIDIMHPISNPNTSNLCPTTPVPVTLNNYTPPISFPGNPLPVRFNLFHMDSVGHILFFPAYTGKNLLSFYISEYRNGKLIGTVLRDVTTIAMTCISDVAQAKLDTTSLRNATIFNRGEFLICQADTAELCFIYKTRNKNTLLYLTDTIKPHMNGYSISYSAQGTDSIRTCIKWTPNTSDSGSYSIGIYARDSTCNSPGFVFWSYGGVGLFVKASPSIRIEAKPGNNIWDGLQVKFNSIIPRCQNSVFQWQVNEIDVPQNIGQEWSQWSTYNLSDQDRVRCLYKCYDTLCMDTTLYISNTITVNKSVSVKDISKNTGVHIYPNPNKGSFTLQFSEESEQTVSLEVINIYGRIIYNKTISRKKQTIALPDITHGLYLLRVSGKSDTHTTRITVQ